MPSEITTLFFCHLLYGLLCAILGRKRNRSGWGWFALALPFGALALFVLLALPVPMRGVRSGSVTGLPA